MSRISRGYLFLATVLALVHTPDVLAQPSALGVKGGLVSATVDSSGVDARTTAAIGLFVRFRIGEHLSIQPEALYLRKGYDATVDGGGHVFEVDYVQFPVLLQYHVPLRPRLAARVFGGPALGLETNCRFEGTPMPSRACNEFIDFGDEVATRSADFGLVLGAGIDVATAGVVLTLDGRYDFGFTDIIEGSGELRNRSWELLAGVGVKLGP